MKGDRNSDIKKYTLTIPRDLLKQIKDLANQKGISVNEFILLAISQELEERN